LFEERWEKGDNPREFGLATREIVLYRKNRNLSENTYRR
jgi:hypothetical protein